MTQVMFLFLIICALLVLVEKRTAMLIVYMAIFSLVTTICSMMMGSLDIAMAEAATSAFMVVFIIVCFENYYGFDDTPIGSHATVRKLFSLKTLVPLSFVIGLFALFVYFIPDVADNTYLRDRYLAAFSYDVGGTNAVTSIYLGYRVYDTLFEALVVVISVVAAVHLSEFGETEVKTEHRSEIENSGMAIFSIQIICPIMILYGIYLILNGHITPGGGFQGGLAVASFFICRYLIYDVNDLPIRKLNLMEDIVFIGICLVAASIVFLGAAAYLPEHIQPWFQTGYMVIMNLLIGLKVACGFIILFYRYIVVEQRGSSKN